MSKTKNYVIVKGGIKNWDEGLPLGNGMIGSLIFGSDKLCFSLDRGGLWDLTPPQEYKESGYNYQNLVKLVRSGKAGNEADWKEYKRLFDGTYKYSYPTKINAGQIFFDFEITPDTVFSLDICDGLAVIKNKNGYVKTFVSADKKVGVAILGKNIGYSVKFPEYYFKKSVMDGLGNDEKKPLGYENTIVKNIDGVVCYINKMHDGTTFGIAIKETERGLKKELRYYVFNKPTEGEAFEDIKETFSASELSFSALYKTHKKWWDNYWKESEITIPDKMLEKTYYLSYYLFGSGSRDEKDCYPMPLQGLWTACNGSFPPWKGDYHHDLNTQFTYLSYFRANHFNAGDSFISYLWDMRDAYRKFAKEFHGVDGYICPAVSTLDGKPLGGWSMYALSPTMSIWLAKSFDDYFEFTGDKSFLREKGYPFFKGVCNAILGIMEEKDGKLYLPLSSSPEYHDATTEAYIDGWSNNDLMLCRYGFETMIKYGKILGTDEKKFEDALNKLDNFYQDDKGVFYLDGNGNYVEETHRHHSNLMAIYPLRTFTYEDGKNERALNLNLSHLEKLGTGLWVGFSYPWFAAMSAIALSANRALTHLRIFSKCFTADNGFHLNGDFKRYGVSQFHYRPFTLESSFCFCDALQEMLIQDHEGFIYLFPCVPLDWKGKKIFFNNFVARGGYYISAKYDGERVKTFTITSKDESKVKIKNVFGKETLKFSNGVTINAKIGEVFELPINGVVRLK